GAVLAWVDDVLQDPVVDGPTVVAVFSPQVPAGGVLAVKERDKASLVRGEGQASGKGKQKSGQHEAMHGNEWELMVLRLGKLFVKQADRHRHSISGYLVCGLALPFSRP